MTYHSERGKTSGDMEDTPPFTFHIKPPGPSKKQIKKFSAQDENFDGNMIIVPHSPPTSENALPKEIAIAEPSPHSKASRYIGEKALSTRSYKDDALRQATFEHATSTNTLQNMMRFQDETLNEHMPTGTVVSVLCDPIVEQTEMERMWDYQRRRAQPLRLAIAPNRRAFDDWLDDLITNRESVIVTNDPVEINKAIFGEAQVENVAWEQHF